MTRSGRGLFLLVVFAVAPVVFARVLSYSPYSNRAGTPAFQSRMADEFLLVEQPGTEFLSPGWVNEGEVVLYDVRGLHEPRVIYPAAGEPRLGVSYAAYSAPTKRVLLQASVKFESQPVTFLGDTEGKTWTRVPELDHTWTYVPELYDRGGFYTRGLKGQVRPVTSSKYLFAVETNMGIWGVDASAHAKRLVPVTAQSWPAIIGNDATGRRLLVRTPAHIAILDLETEALTDLGAVPGSLSSDLQGWLAEDDRAYVINNDGFGQSLYLYRKGAAVPVLVGSAAGIDLFFGAPTHDYNGAWIVTGGPTKPTTLQRHTEAKGVETFWTDITGPQVEAIHPGLTGERLLIQVHRPRVQPERWFIDPALAIWKIGDPAPRDYDELFLNETELKGFVHLDVDQVANGQSFVFNSGLGTSPISRVSPPISGGGDVVQEWGVVRASFKQELVLPGVARLPGAQGSYWKSDVVVYNPLNAEQVITVRFAPLDGEASGTQLQTKTITLAAREIRVVKDVLHEWFGVETGGGSLHIEPTSGVNATGRTYTSTEIGTYGFSMIAIDAYTAAGSRFPLSFAGAFPGEGFRTNIFLTAPRGSVAGARLQAYGVSGEIGNSGITLSTLNSGVWQMNNMHAVLSLANFAEGGLVITPTHGFLIPAVVTIDNITNDPTYFPPDLPAPLVRTIPVVGHVDGANSSKFRSDIYLLNRSTSAQTVTLEAKAWDSNAPAKQVSFTLLPNEDRVIKDVLPRLFGMTGLARLRYSSLGTDGDGVRVTSRAYNLLENGGTLGCLVPPFNSFQSASNGEFLEILGVVGGEDRRANIGLVELSPVANGLSTKVRIEIIDDHGVTIDSFEVTLPAAGGMQINNVFAARGITAPKAALIRIKPNGPGLIGAYATLTDNGTNDPSFLAANLGAQD